MSTSASASAPFTPTTAQRRLLDVVHENPRYLPTRDLCKLASVPRASYYRWCKNPAFRQWLGTAWSSRLLFDGIARISHPPGRCRRRNSAPV